MTTIQLDLPEQLARDAQRAGLLSSERLESWLREQLENRDTDDWFAALDRMAALDVPDAMSPEEIAEELRKERTERAADPLR